MNVLVTGGNGHIGSHVVRALASGRYSPEVGRVSAMVRKTSDRRTLSGLDIELREGDLLNPASLREAMKGIDVVAHVGSVHRNCAADPQDIIAPAVEGTRNVLEVARECGVRRIVYTSTGATVGFSKEPERPLDETSSLQSAKSAYAHGKIEAEKLMRAVAETDGGPEIVILNPSVVLGPLDYRITPATRGLLGLLQGDPAFLHMCVTHVADVGEAHARALVRGKPGRRYLITGDNLAPPDLAGLLGEIAGKRPSTMRPPTFLIKLLVGREEKKAKQRGGDTAATRDAIDDLAGGHLVYDSRRSREELGMEYRDARTVIEDACRWLLHIDALSPKVAERVAATLGAKSRPDPEWPS